MRTNKLLLTAVLTIAGTAAALAQVYSVNMVGYVNTPLKPNWNIIANPLTAADNNVGKLLATAPEGTTVFKWDNVAKTFAGADNSFGWETTITVVPGEAMFVLNPTAADVTITFVGEVPTGHLVNAVKAGFNMLGSKLPMAGKITTDLKYPPSEDDSMFQWNAVGQTYVGSAYSFGAWNDGTPATEPNVAVGEGFWMFTAADKDWVQDYTIGQ